MCIARLLTTSCSIWGGSVCLGGGACPGGVPAGGCLVCIPACNRAGHLAVNRITDSVKTLPCPKLRLWVVINCNLCPIFPEIVSVLRYSFVICFTTKTLNSWIGFIRRSALEPPSLHSCHILVLSLRANGHRPILLINVNKLSIWNYGGVPSPCQSPLFFSYSSLWSITQTCS